MLWTNARDVAADDADLMSWKSHHGAGHAVAQIAPTLRDAQETVRPDPARQPFAVRADGQNNLPPGVLNAAEQVGNLMPEPPFRLYRAYILCQTGLDPTGARLFHHDDQGAPRSHGSGEVVGQNAGIDPLELMNLLDRYVFIDLMHGLAN